MVLGLTGIAIVSTMAMAQEPQKDGKEQHPQKNPAVELALKDCASKIAKDEKGKPDEKLMQVCMKEKSFTKPEKEAPKQ